MTIEIKNYKINISYSKYDYPKTQIIIKADFYISLIWNVSDVNDGK